MSCPRRRPSSTRSPPSCPGVPRTRYFSAAHPARRPSAGPSELDARMVAEHEAEGRRPRGRLADLAFLADQRPVDLADDVVDACALEDDAVLDLRVADDAFAIDA